MALSRKAGALIQVALNPQLDAHGNGLEQLRKYVEELERAARSTDGHPTDGLITALLRLNAFDGFCEASEGTDVGDAWEVFKHLRNAVQFQLRASLTDEQWKRLLQVQRRVKARAKSEDGRENGVELIPYVREVIG